MALVGKRYQIIENLGMGGMGVVYRAFDRLSGNQVALKQVTKASESWGHSTGQGVDLRVALAREFRVLASLRHPNIISVLDYGFDADHFPYYTMDLLENPVTILQASEDQPLDFQIDLLIQTLQALAYLHRWRILHRDLKPENVLVVNGQVKVLDFGLAVPLDQAEADDVTGTLSYLAPEVIMGEASSPAADLYAVGVMAYEILGGRYLYEFGGVTSLVNQILADRPNTDDLPVSSALKQVVERLLAKSPKDRYSDAAQVIQALSVAARRHAPAQTPAIRESFLQAARFVGREAESAQLASALEQALKHSGSAWLIGGESGVGKSRLLEEISHLALVKGMLVARGQAVSETGSLYALWRDVVRRLILMVDVTDSEASVLKMLVSDIAEILGRPIAEPVEIEPALEQTRLFGVTSGLLRRFDQPLLIVLEDLQWAGTESLILLNQITQRIADQPIMIIASFRDEEAPDLPARLPALHLLLLKRFEKTAIVELSESMLGDGSVQPQLVNLLERETEGNIFFLIEVIRVLAEEAGDLDQVGAMTVPATVFAGGIDRVVQRRLRRVPAHWWPALKLAAVAGRYLDLGLLAALDSGTDWAQMLTDCASAAVLDVQDDRWRFSHDKLREGIIKMLEPAESRDLHQRLALTIERVFPQDPDQFQALAFHWHHAGDTTRGARYAFEAGELNLNVSAYQEAIALYEQALAAVDEAQQAYIYRQIASSHWGLSRYETARQTFQHSLKLYQAHDDVNGVASALKGLGDVERRSGNYAQARAYFEESLTLCRRADNPAALGQALARVGLIARIQGDFALAEDYYRASLTVYHTLQMRSHMASLYSGMGLIASDQGRMEEARAYMEQSLVIAREIHNPSGTALILTGLAWVNYIAGNYADAREQTLESLQISRDIGDRWSIGNNLGNLGKIMLRLGDADAALAHFSEALRVAREIQVIPLILEILPGVADLYIQRGQADQAVMLLHKALTHPNSYSEVEYQARPLLDNLRLQMDAPRYAQAVEQAERQSLDDLIDTI